MALFSRIKWKNWGLLAGWFSDAATPSFLSHTKDFLLSTCSKKGLGIHWSKNRRKREAGSGSPELCWVAGVAAQSSSTPSFLLPFWLFGTDMGRGMLRIEFSSERRKKLTSSLSATTTVLSFPFGRSFLFRRGQVRLGFGFSGKQFLNNLSTSILVVRAGTGGPFPTVGSLLFGEWIWAVRSD